MAQLIIKGHATRGKEVIEILEILGGNNANNCYGKYSDRAYYINENGYIDQDFISHIGQNAKFIVFTLEEFLEKFPYKVGDKVITKDKFIGKITDIRWQGDSFFVGKEDGDIVYTVQVSTTAQITYQKEDLQPYKKETMEEKDKAKAPNLIGEDYSGKRFGYQIPNGYEFDCIKNNEIILKPKQPQYPKTYEECCKELNIPFNGDIVYSGNWTYGGEYLEEHLDIIRNFQKLKICRDAYWKIAGEQMGLGKPWEPRWDDIYQKKWIINFYKNKIDFTNSLKVHSILAFPTEKMRDAFYENFKDLIEKCKELL